MPSSVPLVPLPKRSGVDFKRSASAVDPVFSVPLRWTLRVLAWLAFGVASYLAWHAMNQTSVAGCGVGSKIGCDVVLSSSWSKWLGIPVAVLGLAVYSLLAALSVLLGLRSADVNRWITTAFVMLSIAAGAASLWFIAIQIFAIGSFCPYCLVTDACGIAMGVIATVFVVRAAFAQRGNAQPRTLQPGLVALRTALPRGKSSAPLMVRATPEPPSLALTLGGAIPLVALLICGQILFAAKTFDVQKVALNESIEMVGSKANETADGSSTAKTRVAMRLPADADVGERPVAPTDSAKTESVKDQKAAEKSPSTGAPRRQPASGW